MKELKLTTVKVLKKLYEVDFKIAAIRNGINFQKLVNRSLSLYATDEKFKDYINNHNNHQESGSMELVDI